MFNTKYTRAKSKSRIGTHTDYFHTLFRMLPDSVLAKLNSDEIAQLIDLLDQQKSFGEDKMYRELTKN